MALTIPPLLRAHEKAPVPSYLEGGSVRIAVALQDHTGQTILPSAVRLLVLVPGEDEGTLYLMEPHGDEAVAVIGLHMVGLWRYRIESGVEPPAVYEGRFMVEKRQVPEPPL